MKPLYWIAGSLEDLKAFPEPVRTVAGYALYLAQEGGKHHDAKPLRGFSGASVLAISIRHESDAYRVVYSTAFPDAVCVLHAFKKKSRRGTATPKREIDLVRRRWAAARDMERRGLLNRGHDE